MHPGGLRSLKGLPPAEGEGSDFILCRLCRHPYKRITPTHLYWKHRIDSEEYRDRFPNAPFECSETRGIITQAIIANWERLGRHWTLDRVKRTIEKRRAAGGTLHARAIKKRHPTLYGAAMRIVGSWDGALREAGIDPSSVRRRTAWDEKKIASALREAKESGILRRGGHFRRKHSGLVQAAVKRWGSWTAGQIAAGLSPLRPPPIRWTRQVVRRMIEERVRRGESLLATDVHTHAPALKSAAQELYGRHWSEVVRGLGHVYTGRERWTREKVIHGIRRLRRAPMPLRLTAIRRSNPALAQAAVRHFGTWPRALLAAGIDPSLTTLRHWGREELRRLFLALWRAGRLSRRHLRAVRRRGFYRPDASAAKYWKNLKTAFGDLPER